MIESNTFSIGTWSLFNFMWKVIAYIFVDILLKLRNIHSEYIKIIHHFWLKVLLESISIILLNIENSITVYSLVFQVKNKSGRKKFFVYDICSTVDRVLRISLTAIKNSWLFYIWFDFFLFRWHVMSNFKGHVHGARRRF